MRIIPRNVYFMEVAILTSKRSSCQSRQVGAVLVKNNRIISTGYNGTLPGNKHCIECKRKVSGQNLDSCPAIHAEANAILEARKHLQNLENCILYCTNHPCIECIKLLAWHGIKDIVYMYPYTISDTCKQIMRENNMRLLQYDENSKY